VEGAGATEVRVAVGGSLTQLVHEVYPETDRVAAGPLIIANLVSMWWDERK
jgi:hypothetical protein